MNVKNYLLEFDSRVLSIKECEAFSDEELQNQIDKYDKFIFELRNFLKGVGRFSIPPGIREKESFAQKNIDELTYEGDLRATGRKRSRFSMPPDPHVIEKIRMEEEARKKNDDDKPKKVPVLRLTR